MKVKDPKELLDSYREGQIKILGKLFKKKEDLDKFLRTFFALNSTSPALMQEICSKARRVQVVNIENQVELESAIEGSSQIYAQKLMDEIVHAEKLISDSGSGKVHRAMPQTEIYDPQDRFRGRFAVESRGKAGVVVGPIQTETARILPFIKGLLGEEAVSDAEIARAVVGRTGLDYKTARAMVHRARKAKEHEEEQKARAIADRDLVEPSADAILAVVQKLGTTEADAKKRIIEARLRQLYLERAKNVPGRYDAPADIRLYLSKHREEIPLVVRKRILTGKIRGEQAWTMLKTFVEQDGPDSYKNDPRFKGKTITSKED